MLDLADKTLDQMALLIAPGIILMRRFGVLLRWDHRLSTACFNGLNKCLDAVPAIRQHIVKVQACNQVVCLDDVVPFTTRELQAEWITQSIQVAYRLGVGVQVSSGLTFLLRLVLP